MTIHYYFNSFIGNKKAETFQMNTNTMLKCLQSINIKYLLGQNGLEPILTGLQFLKQ